MKRLHVCLMAGAMILPGSAALASSMSLTQFKPKVMAVLVQVNARGQVTKALPSMQLTPRFQRLLDKNLGEWITRPAIVKGHAVDSQMIVYVSLHAKPRKDGDFDASFAYVSRLPSPFGGAAHWVIKDGDQLALVSDAGTLDMGRRREFSPPTRFEPSRPAWNPAMSGSPMTSSSHVATRPAGASGARGR